MTTLLVASTGGHLMQLHQLAPRLVPAGGHRVWVTFDAPQSRSLLEGEDVVYVPYVAPRDWRGVLRVMQIVSDRAVLREAKTAYSTGAALALAVLPVARARGLECHYIESAARSTGPSATGRILAALPGIRTYTQYRSWASSRWPYLMSVFDDYQVDPGGPVAQPVKRVLVTLGTIEGYGFSRLLRRVLHILPAGVEVTWQTGWGGVDDLPIDAQAYLPQRDLLRAMSEADVVIAHAGVGSALSALTVGKCPVLVPRRREHTEHVDDHQQLIAHELDVRGLAVAREVDELTWRDVELAAGTRVQNLTSPLVEESEGA